MRTLIGLVAFALIALGQMSDSTAAQPATDANLVTALDVSDSIMRHDEWIQFDGIARAIVDPAFLRAIARGPHGRVGFSVVVWSSGGNPRVVVPWTMIGSREDAERIAARLRATLGIDRSGYRRPDNDSDSRPPGQRLRTDVSRAIDFSANMIARAPYAATRNVINVCSNGVDNVSGAPDAARNRALAAGAIVNGVVIGARGDVADYFRRHVQAGPGSFVLEARQPTAIADAMLRKFLMDLLVQQPLRPPSNDASHRAG